MTLSKRKRRRERTLDAVATNLEVLLSVADRSKVADRVETLSPDRDKVELFSRDIVVISKKEASEEAVDSSNKVSVVLAFKG